MTSQRVAVTPIKTSSMAPLTTAVRPFACSSVSGKDSRRDRSDRGHGGNRGQNQSHGEPARANLRDVLLDHLSTENRRPLCPAIVLIGDLHVIEPSIALLLSSSFPGGRATITGSGGQGNGGHCTLERPNDRRNRDSRGFTCNPRVPRRKRFHPRR